MIENVTNSCFPEEPDNIVEADARMDAVLKAAFDTEEKRSGIVRCLKEVKGDGRNKDA